MVVLVSARTPATTATTVVVTTRTLRLSIGYLTLSCAPHPPRAQNHTEREHPSWCPPLEGVVMQDAMLMKSRAAGMVGSQQSGPTYPSPKSNRRKFPLHSKGANTIRLSAISEV